MKSAIVLLLCTLLSACGAGSGEGLDNTGRPLEETPAEPPPIDDNAIKPTLASIQTHVFTPICSVCHGGANPAAGQDLSSLEATAANIINVDSSNPLFKRVFPGTPEQSYLYLKIIGDSRAGARMPLGGAALPPDAIEAIRQWIAEGAKYPEVGSATTLISKVEVATFEQPSRTLSLAFWFNKPMDFAGLDAAQIEATAVNSYQSWSLNPAQLKLQVTADNVLKLDISDIDPQIDRLQIRFNQPSISSVLSADGQLLDGDLDTKPGGAFIYDHQF